MTWLDPFFTALASQAPPLFAKSRSLDQILRDLAESSGTAAGIRVTPLNALKCATVYAIVRGLSFALLQLPLQLFERTSDTERERVTDHPVSTLISKPNSWQTTAEYNALTLVRLLLYGNHYAFKAQGNTGPVRALRPIHPGNVEVVQSSRFEISYKVSGDGKSKDFSQDQIHHVRNGISDNGVTGVAPPQEIAEAIGLAIAAERFGSYFFKNNAIPYTVITRPGTFKSDEDYKKFVDSWRSSHSGAGTRKTAILEDGFDVKTLQVTQEDSQFLETRKFQRQEIAGAFGIPPHMIGDLERATFSNIEQQSLDFVIYSLTPWATLIEQAMGRDLLSDDDRARGLFLKFKMDALLRGDFKTRWEGFRIAREIGGLNANEIRALEQLPQRDDPDGDAYLWPANMKSTSDEPEVADSGDSGDDDEPDEGNQP